MRTSLSEFSTLTAAAEFGTVDAAEFAGRSSIVVDSVVAEAFDAASTLVCRSRCARLSTSTGEDSTTGSEPRTAKGTVGAGADGSGSIILLRNDDGWLPRTIGRSALEIYSVGGAIADLRCVDASRRRTGFVSAILVGRRIRRCLLGDFSS